MVTAAVLIVPGLNGSGPEHWQSIWQRQRDNCRRVEQARWHDPDPASWSATLDAAIAAVPGPLVIVAHSLGCATVAHWAARAGARQQRLAALLVAPCDVERPEAPAPVRRFAPLPRGALRFASVVVASRDDPYATLDRSRCLADGWGSTFVDAGALGHINAASGLGDWEFGQVLLDELVARVAAPAPRYHRAAALRSAGLALAGTPCAGGGFTESARP